MPMAERARDEADRRQKPDHICKYRERAHGLFRKTPDAEHQQKAEEEHRERLKYDLQKREP